MDIPDRSSRTNRTYRVLSPLAKDILTLLEKNRHLSTASLEFMTGASRTAVKNTMQKLLREDYIVMHGFSRRAVIYTLPGIEIDDSPPKH